ncbi:MAG: hypothetical protein PHR28_00165, partial [candidate division Zixibacteria bacterium]|nr:hypothetical protein [candidate division Zixibacteria bacterium]
NHDAIAPAKIARPVPDRDPVARQRKKKAAGSFRAGTAMGKTIERYGNISPSIDGFRYMGDY